ncbi:peroxidase 7-like [Cucurbita moschata]|uniref:Peroxidase n=1 Tax=Cucurbita moschata TaxID=3662 RepID=A0A6J1G7I0_CUCMO|nr:peroxidase 7-like [Cucurbita moschata]
MASMASFVLFLLFHLHLVTAALGVQPVITAASMVSRAPPPPASLLSHSFYRRTCPDAEGIIHRKVQAWVNKDFTLAAALIRLHFHDCAVRGCDASILLNYRRSERRALASKTLRGFRVIDDIKAELERKCPRTVSCSDILTAAARDATILAGGPFWEVPFGRKDGRITIAAEAERVPQGRENVTALIDYFRHLGLDVLDLVALSGAHTIGRAACHTFNDRLYNFNRTRKPDPNLKPPFLNLLRRQCKKDMDLVFLDATTPKMFDTAYFKNLQKKLGLLTTDQALQSDERTSSFVDLMGNQPFLFESQFSASMVKLGNVGVLVRKNEGEIRVNCNFINRRRK